MLDVLKELLKLPYAVVALILGVALILFPYIVYDAKTRLISMRELPVAWWPIVLGSILLVVSVVAFSLTILSGRPNGQSGVAGGLDMSVVHEDDRAVWTKVQACEIRVIHGRIEDLAVEPNFAVVLPCNEYFDDRCVEDPKSALGAYVTKHFEGRLNDFVTLMKEECGRQLGPGVEQQKTATERAQSFGAGRCALLLNPLGRSVPLALISTTTQRANEGLAAKTSFLFEGMEEMVGRLADARLTGVNMPVLGAGHGNLDSAFAFVGLLLAVAEAARYGRGGQRLRRVNIVVFEPDPAGTAEVDPMITRRALALIGARS